MNTAKWKKESYKLISMVVNEINTYNALRGITDYKIPGYCKDLMTGIINDDMSVYRQVFRNGFPIMGTYNPGQPGII